METIALAGLTSKEDTLGSRLFGGQRRRFDFALALIGDPELVFLDEPTERSHTLFGTKTALDPSNRMMTALRSQRTLSHAALVVTVALLTGCSGSVMACTAIGCESGVTVFAPATIRSHDVKRMKICLDGSCKTISVAPHSKVSVLARDSVATESMRPQRGVMMSLTLESADKTNLITAHGSVQFHRIAPNGVSCGPVCYESNVIVHRSGSPLSGP